MTDELPFYSPNLKPGIPRKRAPGLEVWRLRCGDHIQTCELRDDSRVGAGWDVLVLETNRASFSFEGSTFDIPNFSEATWARADGTAASPRIT